MTPLLCLLMRVFSLLHLSDVNYSYCVFEDFGVTDSPAPFGVPVAVSTHTEYIQQLVPVKANDGISVS